MSTGGLSLCLALTPHKFRGLHTIGLITFILTIALFVLFTACMLTRIRLYPTHVRQALRHPAEAWFLGALWLSISTLVGGTQVYGITHGPGYSWLVDAVYVLYWIYACLSLFNSLLQYSVLVAASSIRPIPFSPAVFLAGYSAMLTGTLASLIAASQPPQRAYFVVLSGVAFQGFGWLLSSICLVGFAHMLLDKGLPAPALRPALFIPVGSVAYTIVALLGLAEAIPAYAYFETHAGAREICHVLALVVGVFMWLFAFFLFAVAFVANLLAARKMRFGLSWWAFIFPNVGFMLATNAIGRELESEAVLWVASVLTILLVAMWLVSAIGCVRAVWMGQIVWPGKDEDKDV
jgi:C4-dicarboxylate transporter/malic acid transport protein